MPVQVWPRAPLFKNMNFDAIINFLSGCIPAIEIDLIARLFIALFLGILIGLEREITHKNAGLRTHALVCMGSALFTVLSIYGFSCESAGADIRLVHDPSRIAAQVVTGIGFIGGGVVLHHGMNIYGLTTAATLWVTASIGMAAGTGAYSIAVLSTILTLIALICIRSLEKRFFKK